MDDKEMSNITVLIAGRPYPLKIKVGDEQTIRKIVKEVNDKVNEFQLAYAKKDKQDCLSMALLTYGVDMHKIQTNSTDTPVSENALSDKIHQLDELLDRLLV